MHQWQQAPRLKDILGFTGWESARRGFNPQYHEKKKLGVVMHTHAHIHNCQFKKSLC
jgi:hypothetical protein